MKFSREERKILIDLICNEQTHMIMKNPKSYMKKSYKELEKLKIKVKDNKEM